jgi:starch-binding outer membrane protein, SusD/RagB family
MKSNINIFFFLLFGCLISCKKLVQIPPPVSSITTSQVFADSSDAAAAILGLYSSMGYANEGFATGLLTIYPGESADELLSFNDRGDDFQLSTNTVLSSNGTTSYIWQLAYSGMYAPNAIIGGLQASTSISPGVKSELMGEAKWFRAFINFYLVNLFGNIPLITSVNFVSTAVTSNAPSSQVYQLIITDLQDAQNSLASDYSAGYGERIRVNKWAATALLARVYLYQQIWDSAEDQASAVINNVGLYSLDSNLNNVFLADSPEAILQWQNNSSLNVVTYNGTSEGSIFIPYDSTTQPNYYLTNQLLNGFENGDLRKAAWLDSTDYSGITYYYPYKYKVGPAQQSANAPITEYYTVLRLAEQYLIRAEARAQEGKLPEAIMDLNTIRNRAHLTPLLTSLSQSQVLAAVAQERRIELFAEWGHRWLDLKRTGQVGTVFSTIPYKSAYQPFQQLYPIPPSEMQADPNLRQNPGYH